MLALFFIILIILWGFSIYLLSYWKYTYWFAFINALFIALYLSIIIFGDKYFWKNDGIGLGMFLRIFFSTTVHTILGFIFAIYKSYQLRKDERSAKK